jgi:hypothetical protein
MTEVVLLPALTVSSSIAKESVNWLVDQLVSHIISDLVSQSAS